MASGRRKASDKSPMPSRPPDKRSRQSLTQTPPSGEATVNIDNISDTFSRLEVTPTSRSKRIFLSQLTSRTEWQYWIKAEIQSLLNYLMLYTDGSFWVGHKHSKFWGEAGKFIQSQNQTFHCRSGINVTCINVTCIIIFKCTGTACRSKKITLATRFISPAQAEKHYDNSSQKATATTSSAIASTPSRPISTLGECKQLIAVLPREEQLSVLVELFSWLDTAQHDDQPLFPPDFLNFVFCAAQQLRDCGRLNVLYLLAKGLATIRPDRSDSVIPVKRMPMGLLEYTIGFFTVNSIQQVFRGVNMHH